MRVRATRGKKAAVACGHSLAKTAAIGVFAEGGNVADAAVAGALALNVVLPQACSLGGDCFILVHVGGETRGINGSGPSPSGLPDLVAPEQLASGPLSCAVPGALGALEALHRECGKLSWSRVIAPAIDLARNGVPVSRDLARGMQENVKRLRADPGCRALFLANDRPYAEEGLLRQPAMARALDTIAADGAAAFYRGPLGKQLCRTVHERGGVLAAHDLESYAPIWAKPLETRYRGYTVRAMPPNSYGAIMLMQLAALDGCDLSALRSASPERLRLLIIAARESFRLGRPFIADPVTIGASVGNALGAQVIGAIRDLLHADAKRPTETAHGHGTAVISVANDAGEGVAIVQSVFAPFGALVADPATGFVLNNRLMGFSPKPGDVNAPAPGKRPAHTLNPGMAFEGERLALVLATPGGSGQTITLTQVLSNIVDHGMPLDAAIDAPRWSMDLKGNFTLEESLGTATVEALAKRGIETRIATPEQRFFFGSAECVEIQRDGTLMAAADHRREADAGAI